MVARVPERVPHLRIVGIAVHGLLQRSMEAAGVDHPSGVRTVPVQHCLERLGDHEQALARRQPVIEAACSKGVRARQGVRAQPLPAQRRADAVQREGKGAVEGDRTLVVGDRRVPRRTTEELLAAEERFEGGKRRRAEGREPYGTDRLDKRLVELRSLPAAELARAVTEDARSYAGGELSDDLAVVVIHRRS